jgi:hypothetical protein
MRRERCHNLQRGDLRTKDAFEPYFKNAVLIKNTRKGMCIMSGMCSLNNPSAGDSNGTINAKPNFELYNLVLRSSTRDDLVTAPLDGVEIDALLNKLP